MMAVDTFFKRAEKNARLVYSKTRPLAIDSIPNFRWPNGPCVTNHNEFEIAKREWYAEAHLDREMIELTERRRETAMVLKEFRYRTKLLEAARSSDGVAGEVSGRSAGKTSERPVRSSPDSESTHLKTPPAVAPPAKAEAEEVRGLGRCTARPRVRLEGLIIESDVPVPNRKRSNNAR